MGDVTRFPGQPRRRGRYRLVDDETGEILDARIHARKSGFGVSMMYGGQWAAVPARSWLAMTEALGIRNLDIRVFSFMCARAEMGNYVRLRAVDVCTEMGLDKDKRGADVAACLARLRRKRLIHAAKPFGFRIDPNFMWRGNPEGQVGKRRDGRLVLL